MGKDYNLLFKKNPQLRKLILIPQIDGKKAEKLRKRDTTEGEK